MKTANIQLGRRRNRAGITVTEALASIGVAAVGLFAVLAVIPFAARQAESGLDLDIGVTIGKNAFHDFDVRGMGNVSNWRLPYVPGSPSQNNFTPAAAFWPGKAVVIDPLYLTNNWPLIDVTVSDPATNPEVAAFPFPDYHTDPSKPDYAINRINLAALGVPYDYSKADSVFRSMNELEFELPVDDLDLPLQKFKRDGTVVMDRQYEGEITWMAMVVPDTNDATGVNPHMYRLYVIVFKNRQMNYRTGNASGEAVYSATVSGNGTGVGGGDFDFDLIDTSADEPVSGLSNQLVADDYLNAGDWVLLTDYTQTRDNGLGIPETVSVGTNWRWYRIRRVDVTGEANRNGCQVTLAGPDWTGDVDSFNFPGIRSARAIVMSNVIAVYEKTIRIEYDSIWNE